jgi:hypothetical protein
LSSDRSDRPGTKNPLTYAMQQAFESMMRSMMVCLPGRVMSFNADDQTAQIQCGIQRIIDGQPVDIPVIENVPVQFPGNDKWYLWHEITKGTEGLIHFSQRAIDLWIERGGSVKPQDTRMFSAEDAFFVPGVRPRPKRITGFQNSGAGISNYAGTTRIHLTDDKITMTAQNIEINGQTLQNGDFSVQGNMDVSGDVAAGGDVTAGSISLTNHAHPINSGSSAPGPTGPPE